jgi:hypothetical protein
MPGRAWRGPRENGAFVSFRPKYWNAQYPALALRLLRGCDMNNVKSDTSILEHQLSD